MFKIRRGAKRKFYFIARCGKMFIRVSEKLTHEDSCYNCQELKR